MSRPPSAIDYKNSKRAPLLLIAGAEDHIVPATVVRSNYRKYKYFHFNNHLLRKPQLDQLDDDCSGRGKHGQ